MIAIEPAEPEKCPYCKEGIVEHGYIGDQHVFYACEYCAGSGYRLRCGDCGEYLELVRPGKWQCINPTCPAY